MGEKQDKGQRTIQSVEKACQIVRALRELDGAGVTEIADQVNMSKGSAHTYLKTLQRNNIVTEIDGRYQLGLFLLELGEYVKHQNEVWQFAQEPLEEMAAETGELARLIVREQGYGVYLAKAAGEHAIETTIRPGQREYLHYTSQGKAILAHMSEAEVRKVIDTHGLPKRTEKTITESAELFEELEEIRERGIAFSQSERTRGLRCVAAPIHAPSGTVVAAIGVCGPTSRMRGDRFREELPTLVRDKANVIEVNMQMDAD
ncbi:IclR family transcriptional regulator [Natrinema sp. 1APR25-10V2]|uniref:IclR family transcriptional regulator n=1 Tax=Natrinema sp. 1APR25-10V2 TaxID=2951081 RepID=UPI0028745513|nr:IclR family transcriptional regulator [Natrinema sp. 1APR25-10V2]MDS0477315.1 IclR family transcriptional regulator [Natrinema sp. 1APR25-10V2]